MSKKSQCTFILIGAKAGIQNACVLEHRWEGLIYSMPSEKKIRHACTKCGDTGFPGLSRNARGLKYTPHTFISACWIKKCQRLSSDFQCDAEGFWQTSVCEVLGARRGPVCDCLIMSGSEMQEQEKNIYSFRKLVGSYVDYLAGWLLISSGECK